MTRRSGRRTTARARRSRRRPCSRRLAPIATQPGRGARRSGGGAPTGDPSGVAVERREARPRRPRRRPRSSRATGPRGGRPRAAAIDESMRAAEGFGAAGPPPGRPSGTVLNFGRYAGWSLGEVARQRHRVHRVARPRADRPELPPGDRRDPAHERPAQVGRRGRDGPARACSAAGSALGRRSSPVGASRVGARAASRHRRSRSSPIVRSTTHPIVVPWTSSVNRTTPKVISWSSARCGMSAGSDSAIATATAPRRPAQNRTWSQPVGTALGEPRAGRQTRRAAEEDVDHERPPDEDRRRSPRRSARASRARRSRRDGEADQQEDDGRQQVGEELPDRVDGVRAGRRTAPGPVRRSRARSRR